LGISEIERQRRLEREKAELDSVCFDLVTQVNDDPLVLAARIKANNATIASFALFIHRDLWVCTILVGGSS
jgi:hypothetical protein